MKKVVISLIALTSSIGNAYDWANNSEDLAALTALAYASADLISTELDKIDGNNALTKASASLSWNNSQALNYYPTSMLEIKAAFPVLENTFIEASAFEQNAFVQDSDITFFGGPQANKVTRREIAVGHKINPAFSIKAHYSKHTDDEKLSYYLLSGWPLTFGSDYKRKGLKLTFNENDFLELSYDYSKANGIRGVNDMLWETNTLSYGLTQLSFGDFGSHDYEDIRKTARLTINPDQKVSLWIEKSKTDFKLHIKQYSPLPAGCTLAYTTLFGSCFTWPTYTLTGIETKSYSYKQNQIGASYKFNDVELQAVRYDYDWNDINKYSAEIAIDEHSSFNASYDSFNEFTNIGFKVKFN